jgi:hypothetical protein
MGSLHRAALVAITLTAFTATGLAEPGPDGAPPTGTSNDWSPPGVAEDEQPADDKPKEPKRGDFDAGGQLRLPSGPDDMGEFATFNWVAVDLVGRYFLLDSVTVNGNIPLAIIKPDDYMGTEPALIGGMNVRLEARMPKMPFGPKSAKESEIAVVLSGAYMREGAMLLSAKDFPYFSGGFQPGLTAGAIAKVKLSSLIDFSMTPLFVYQSGTDDALTAVQLPTSLILGLGSVAKVSADLGIFTGDDYSFRGSNGGRLSTGGSLTLKIGPILAHAGAGVASLLTGGMYPTIRDSVYIDLNVKYAK